MLFKPRQGLVLSFLGPFRIRLPEIKTSSEAMRIALIDPHLALLALWFGLDDLPRALRLLQRHLVIRSRDREAGRDADLLDVVVERQHAGVSREGGVHQGLAVGLVARGQIHHVVSTPAIAGCADGEVSALVATHGFEERLHRREPPRDAVGDEPGDQAVEQPEPVNSLKGQPQVPGQRKNED